jgi:phage I-like protein
MDRQFLEFWGNYLLAAAKGQKQLEDLNQWIRQEFRGFEDLSAMFSKFYGLERPHKEDPDSIAAWKDAAADFRNSINAYFNLMGVVPKDEYQALKQKYATLQKKVDEQEDTINGLRKLLAEKGTYQGETVKVFQDLVKKQGDAFEKLMGNLAVVAEDEK